MQISQKVGKLSKIHQLIDTQAKIKFCHKIFLRVIIFFAASTHPPNQKSFNHYFFAAPTQPDQKSLNRNETAERATQEDPCKQQNM